jgi:hypothetical protein
MLMMHAQLAMLPPPRNLICDSPIAFPRFLARQPGRHWKEDWPATTVLFTFLCASQNDAETSLEQYSNTHVLCIE